MNDESGTKYPINCCPRRPTAPGKPGGCPSGTGEEASEKAPAPPAETEETEIKSGSKFPGSRQRPPSEEPGWRRPGKREFWKPFPKPWRRNAADTHNEIQ